MSSSFLSCYLFTLFFLLSPILGIPQQTDTSYRVNGHSSVIYRSLHFTNDSSGWVVGDSGVIGHWMPNGNEWVDQSSGTDKRLHSVHFPVEDTGWAVGDSGTILHTMDGGTNWTSQSSGDSSTLRSVYFPRIDTGWAVGDSGTILYTSDGGTNWNSQTSGTSIGLNSVQFSDASLGWIVGDTGVVLRTTDGGNNWSIHPTVADTLHDVSFLNDTLGWTTGVGGGIAHTEDGGMTWSLQEDTNSWAGTYFSIQMLDTATGWAFGNSNIGKLYDPNSGVSLWSPVVSNSFLWTRSHHFFTVDTGWVASGTTLEFYTNADSLEYSGVEERDEVKMEMKVHPNPTSGQIHIELGRTFKKARITIRDLRGRTVKNEHIKNTSKFRTAIEGEPGLYFVELETVDGLNEVRKVMKE